MSLHTGNHISVSLFAPHIRRDINTLNMLNLDTANMNEKKSYQYQ